MRRTRRLAPMVLACSFALGGCGGQLTRIETDVGEVSSKTDELDKQQEELADDLGAVRGMLESEGLTSDEERADLLARFASMERTVRQLDARIEEQEALLQRIYAAVDVLAKRPVAVGPPVDAMVTGGEESPGPGGESSGAAGDEGSVDPGLSASAAAGLAAGAVLAAGDEAQDASAPVTSGSAGAEVYDAAFRDFTRGSYSLARDGFEEFLARYPETELSDNAAYWIGETWYAQGNYTEALQQFDTVLRRYPDGDILAAALLKAANCHAELDERDRAIEGYQHLMREHPESDEAFIAQHKLADLGVSP